MKFLRDFNFVNNRKEIVKVAIIKFGGMSSGGTEKFLQKGK